jgi:hypothetical protein
MMRPLSAEDLTFDGPAVYRICVCGRIPAGWTDRVEDMRISADPSETRRPVTTLTGELVDQTSLVGVLHTLYLLRLPVLSVECLRATSG